MCIIESKKNLFFDLSQLSGESIVIEQVVFLRISRPSSVNCSI